MNTILLVRYGEIHLKGLNRPFFERSLVDALKRAIYPQRAKVIHESGRIYVRGIPQELCEEYAHKLADVFGVHSVSIAYEVEKDFDIITQAAVTLMEDVLADGKARTFKVQSKRADKRFPMQSLEIDATLGGRLLERFDLLKVDVHKPELIVGVEVRREFAYVYAGAIMGPGGMPVGCNGKAMLLISGGIDSPVAGYMIAKRGVALSAIHFYSYPYTSERARDKVVDLARLVSKYAGPMDVYLVPFTEIQLAIYEQCPQAETTVLMRRLMMEIAEQVAKNCGAQALITGESLGQVASQTIESLTVTNDAVDMPVFRPLIGFDKEEIVERAKKIGTFETSILPYEDCCTVFVPQHPVTKPTVERLRASEQLVDFAPMIEKAIADAELLKISPYDA